MPRSPSYSPPRRGDSPRRGRSPNERGPRKPEAASLLVRNIPRDLRAEELRVPFEQYGPVKDVYLPRDYHTQEPRGFGFVQFVDGEDAKAAQRGLDRTLLGGREITVVFAEENRKRPQDMRERERAFSRSRVGGGYRRSPPPYSHHSARSYSRSPPRRRYTPSPPPRRTSRYRSPSPPPRPRDPYQEDYPPRQRPLSPPYGNELPPRGYLPREPPMREPPMRGPPRGRSPPPYDGPPRGRSPPLYDGPMRGRSPPPYAGPARGRSPLYD